MQISARKSKTHNKRFGRRGQARIFRATPCSSGRALGGGGERARGRAPLPAGCPRVPVAPAAPADLISSPANTHHLKPSPLCLPSISAFLIPLAASVTESSASPGSLSEPVIKRPFWRELKSRGQRFYFQPERRAAAGGLPFVFAGFTPAGPARPGPGGGRPPEPPGSGPPAGPRTHVLLRRAPPKAEARPHFSFLNWRGA